MNSLRLHEINDEKKTGYTETNENNEEIASLLFYISWVLSGMANPFPALLSYWGYKAKWGLTIVSGVAK